VGCFRSNDTRCSSACLIRLNISETRRDREQEIEVPDSESAIRFDTGSTVQPLRRFPRQASQTWIQETKTKTQYIRGQEKTTDVVVKKNVANRESGREIHERVSLFVCKGASRHYNITKNYLDYTLCNTIRLY